MPVNSMNEFVLGVRNLPPLTPSDDLLTKTRTRMYRRGQTLRQIRQTVVVSVVCVAVLALTWQGDPMSNSMLAETDSLDARVEQNVIPENTTRESRVVRYEVPDPIVTQAVILMDLVEIDEQISKLGPEDSEQRQKLLNTQDAIEKSYQIVREDARSQVRYQRASYY